MIQPIPRSGFVVVGAEIPAAIGNGDAKLPLDIPLAVQRSESKTLTGGQILQRAGCRHEWRRLIEVAVEAAKHPIQARNFDRNAKTGVGPFSEMEASNAVSRRPAMKVNHGVTLNLSLMNTAVTPPLAPMEEGATLGVRPCTGYRSSCTGAGRIRRRRLRDRSSRNSRSRRLHACVIGGLSDG